MTFRRLRVRGTHNTLRYRAYIRSSAMRGAPLVPNRFASQWEADLMTDGVTHIHTHFCVSPRLPATAEKIEQWTKECLELAEQKVVLANEALVLVNANTKKLDKDIAKYKSIESNSKRRQASAAASGRMAAQGTGRGRKKNDGPDPPPIHYIPPTNAATAERYCYCRQISYGEMIGCDNPHCKIEWFHFECVGLTTETKPKVRNPDLTTRAARALPPEAAHVHSHAFSQSGASNPRRVRFVITIRANGFAQHAKSSANVDERRPIRCK